MTENTPKKPRRKRRTKAQIEADKAAELAAKEEKEVEMTFGSSYEKEIDEIVEEKSDIPYEPVVRDRDAEHTRTAKKVEEECIPCQKSAAAALAAAEAAIETEEVVSEEPAASVPELVSDPEPLPQYTPKTGLAKLRHKIAQRQLKDRYRNARLKSNPGS